MFSQQHRTPCRRATDFCASPCGSLFLALVHALPPSPPPPPPRLRTKAGTEMAQRHAILSESLAATSTSSTWLGTNRLWTMVVWFKVVIRRTQSPRGHFCTGCKTTVRAFSSTWFRVAYRGSHVRWLLCSYSSPLPALSLDCKFQACRSWLTHLYLTYSFVS